MIGFGLGKMQDTINLKKKIIAYEKELALEKDSYMINWIKHEVLWLKKRIENRKKNKKKMDKQYKKANGHLPKEI
jgi:hypothetical protein